jgi:3-oxoacyl-[acyl-carrier protein] reductase
MLRLDGKTALVTGAGQNIGAATARLMAQQGATVIVNDFYLDRAEAVAGQIRAAGGTARAVAFDVTNREQVIEAVAEAADREGPVDILVNNAGNAGVDGTMGLKPFAQLAPGDWSGPINSNLYGMFNCVGAVIDGMMERRWGRIIVHTSGAGLRGLDIGVSIYGAAKAGQIGFMRHLAVESASFGVTCNTIAVGLVLEKPVNVQHLADEIPLKRLGKPEDIGNMAVFLASEEASWITGQVINVNGGAIMN